MNTVTSENSTFSVGGLATRLHPLGKPWQFYPVDPAPKFLNREQGELELRIEYVRESNLPTPKGESLNSSRLWRWIKNEDEYWLLTNDPKRKPLRFLQLNADFNKGILYLNGSYSRLDQIFPLECPVSDLLYAFWLPHKDGLVFHGASFVHNGEAIVAIGHSGDGKSTLSELWADRFGTDSVLSDERTVIRRNADGTWFAYGTPWQGSGKYAQPKNAPLSQIVTLRKSSECRLERQKPFSAFENLMSHVILPPGDSTIITLATTLAETISKDLPMSTFSFPKSSKAAEFLEFNLFLR